MSTPLTQTDVILKRVISPTETEIDLILKAMVKGFETEIFATRWSIPQSTLDIMSSEDYYKAQHMCWLGPALIDGQVWTVSQKEDGAILGVGIWSEFGSTLGDTPEKRKFHETFGSLISPEQIAFQAKLGQGVVAERRNLFPDLWRQSIHLHNLVTIPESRGKGVGGMIMDEMIKQAREKGQIMSLCTPTQSKKRFYEKHGFKTVWERDITHDDRSVEGHIVMTQDPVQ